MPLTAKGRKIKKAMIEKYGYPEGARIFYASERAGKIKGVTVKRKKKSRAAT
jgi:hypothetical protein